MARNLSSALAAYGAVSSCAFFVGIGWHSPLAWTLAFVGYSIALAAILVRTYRISLVSLVAIYVVSFGALSCVESYLKWFSTSESFHRDFLGFVLLVSIPIAVFNLLIYAAVPVFLYLLYKKNWKCLLVPALAVGSPIYLMIPFCIDQAMKQSVVYRAEQGMAPVVKAIRDYQLDSGNAPPSIEALMPIYLSSEPNLNGIARGLRYSYARCGNAWKLFLNVGAEAESRFLIEYDHEVGWSSR